MENIKYKGTARVLNTAASLLLFLIFAICMMVIIAAGAGIYSRINSGYEMTYGSSAATRYVSNKIRASDSSEIIEDGKGVLLKSGNIVCVIYTGTDGIYEKNISADSEVTAEGGDLVIKLDGFSVTEHDGLYEISVNCGGDISSVLVRKGDYTGKD